VEKVFSAPVFHEAVIRVPKPASVVLQTLADKGIQGGIDLGVYYPGMEYCILLCVTETKTESDLQLYADALHAALK
jgi:glycine dehydrogenase subunit 1